MEIRNIVEVPEDEFAALSSLLATHDSLAKVLQWAGAGPAGVFCKGIVSEVITQDEYCHDVIVPYRDLFLVYDTT